MILKKFLNNHLIMSGIYKGISGMSLFLSIRILLDYLGVNSFGIWTLIFTFFQFVLLMDFGIQSSLKTKIPQLKVNFNKIIVLKYIKTTYFYSALISILIFVFFVISNYFIDYHKVFNIKDFSKLFILKLFIINVFFFCLNFVANIHKSLYVAYLRGKFSEASIAVNQLIFFICLVIFTNLNLKLNEEDKLYFISFMNGVICFLINFIYTILFIKSENLNFFKFSIKIDVKKYFNENIKLGLKFMLTQILILFIFSSDTYLISYFSSPEKVPSYEVVNKLFQLPFLITTAAISPLWSIFSKLYNEKKKTDIYKIIRKFNFIFIIIFIIILFIFYFTPTIISIWIKKNISFPAYFILSFAIITILRLHSTFYTFFLNGIGKLKVFIFILIISALIKIPLCLYFNHLNFDVLNSVVFSNIIILLFWSLIIPFYCKKIISEML